MRVPAVDFDDETMRAPEEVHRVPVEMNVHFRLGKAMAAADAEEQRLELRTGSVGLGLGIDGEVKELGFADGSGVFGLPSDLAEILEGSGWIRHRNPTVHGALAMKEGFRAMQADASALRAAAVPWDGDVDRSCTAQVVVPAPPRQDAPQCRCAPVAQDCGIAVSKHRRHPPAFLAEAAMADGINSAMNGKQPAGADAISDTAAGEAVALELGRRHDAVLVCRDPRDGRVAASNGEFARHTRTKSPSAPISPPALGQSPFIAGFRAA